MLPPLGQCKGACNCQLTDSQQLSFSTPVEDEGDKEEKEEEQTGAVTEEDYWVFTLQDPRYKQNLSTLIPDEERSMRVSLYQLALVQKLKIRGRDLTTPGREASSALPSFFAQLTGSQDGICIYIFSYNPSIQEFSFVIRMFLLFLAMMVIILIIFIIFITMPYNITTVTEIFLLGLQDFQSIKTFFFPLMLLTYCVTIGGNLLIIVVVSSSRSLHSPMYFFLTQLSALDILLSTTITPIMLCVVLYEGSSLSLLGCLIQFYCFVAIESLECLLLTVMSYDRYHAICNPLHYTSVINFPFCVKSMLLSWLFVFLIILMFSVTMSQLQFCGPNVIDHFFCDRDPILELSCSDTFIVKMEGQLLALPLAVCPFLVIIVSYVYIIRTILQIPSVTGRQKTFSTCSSHLAVVSLYYGSLLNIYLFPNKEIVKKLVSLLYKVVTPLVNPMIYSLRNKDIKQAIEKLVQHLHNEFHIC
ncbi:olfactory receptor 5P64-like [Dendropsophus ebraccatus]|uniref:olfactory receptor 5P64-like n=1 Tax=Dendropsophus ebraccatus TaxID=150705 RepID=UPI003831AE63